MYAVNQTTTHVNTYLSEVVALSTAGQGRCMEMYALCRSIESCSLISDTFTGNVMGQNSIFKVTRVPSQNIKKNRFFNFRITGFSHNFCCKRLPACIMDVVLVGLKLFALTKKEER